MNSKKYIVSFFLLLTLCFSICAQNNSAVTNENQSTVFDENSTDYFSNPANSSDSNNTSTGRRQTSTAWMFIRMILVLVVVCALIYLVFWFLKRKTKIVNTENEYLRRAAFINIGPNKTIEVITLIDKAYLIGVTEDNITMLGEIDDKELIQSMNLTADKKNNVKNPVNFAEVLEMFTKKSTKANAFNNTEKSLDSMLNSLGNQEEK